MRRPPTALLLGTLALAACAGQLPQAEREPQSCLAHADPAPAPPGAPRSFADFRPSLHGFAFRNDFQGSPLPINLGSAERALKPPSHYGLCGGMSSAAADFYLAGCPIPIHATPPAHGTPLYTYLYTRQSASL